MQNAPKMRTSAICASVANGSPPSSPTGTNASGATMRTVASGIWSLSLLACASPTQPQRMGCTLSVTVAESIAPVTIAAHYQTCPAPAGSTVYAYQGQTFTVRWD